MAVTVIRDVTTRSLDTRVRVTMVTHNLRLILIVAWRPMVCLCFQYFYSPSKKLRGGNVFSCLYLSICLFMMVGRRCLCSGRQPWPTYKHPPLLYKTPGPAPLSPPPDIIKFVHYEARTVGT